jgi:hypothetical protein
MIIKLDDKIDRRLILDEIEEKIGPIRNSHKRKLFKIITNLIATPNLILNGKIDFDITSGLNCEAEINITKEELLIIREFEKLRSRLNSPYLTTPETMQFYFDNNCEILRNGLNDIIHHTQRMKGEITITEKELFINISIRNKE